MDNSSFLKGKNKTLVEYQKNRKSVASAIGAKGFSYEPGFMYDIQNDLEMDVKFKLSDLNYGILSESVARELKQSGLDYDLAYQAAVIQWEVDKSVLLSTWQKELSVIKQERAHEEELLKLLAIETSLRGNVLLAAKTAIDLAIEGYRQQIAALDGTTGTYETDLAQKKLLTAQKKLELIPFIEELIVVEEQILTEELNLVDKQWIITGKVQDILPKEYEILSKTGQLIKRQHEVIDKELLLIAAQERLVSAETGRLDDKTDLTDAEATFVQYKESTIRPALIALIATMDNYVKELVIQLGLYAQISDIKIDIADIKQQQADKKEEIILAKTDLNNVMTDLIIMAEALAQYKSSVLAVAISNLMNIYTNYAVAIMDQITIKTATTDIKTLIAGIHEDQIDKEFLNYGKELTIDQQRKIFNAAVLSLDSQRESNTLGKYTQDNSNLIAYVNEYVTTHVNTLSKRNAAFNDTSGHRVTNKGIDLDIKQTNDEKLEVERRHDVNDRRVSSIDRIRNETNIKILSQGVTARLNHILTQVV